jgi:hypothetical protein
VGGAIVERPPGEVLASSPSDSLGNPRSDPASGCPADRGDDRAPTTEHWGMVMKRWKIDLRVGSGVTALPVVPATD